MGSVGPGSRPRGWSWCRAGGPRLRDGGLERLLQGGGRGVQPPAPAQNLLGCGESQDPQGECSPHDVGCRARGWGSWRALPSGVIWGWPLSLGSSPCAGLVSCSAPAHAATSVGLQGGGSSLTCGAVGFKTKQKNPTARGLGSPRRGLTLPDPPARPRTPRSISCPVPLLGGCGRPRARYQNQLGAAGLTGRQR